MADKLTVLVTGATGHQGGATARALLQHGHTVRAMTRHIDSVPAQALQKLGAKLVTGDFADRPSLEKAARGCDAMFLVTTPQAHGTEGEIRDAMAAIDTARHVGVRHLLYASVAAANLATGVPLFESKYTVERYLHDSPVPYTIVGPVWFAENLFSPWMLPNLQQGKLILALPGDRLLQQVTLADIGAFNRFVLENRGRFLGERIDIASFEVSLKELAQAISRVSGRNVAFVEQPLAEVRAANPDMARLLDWLAHDGYRTDMHELRREYPEVGWHDFAPWLRTVDWQAQLGASGQSGVYR